MSGPLPTCTLETNVSDGIIASWRPCQREARWFVKYPGGWFPRCEEHRRHVHFLTAVGIDRDRIEVRP